jgi:hypothetical protein
MKISKAAKIWIDCHVTNPKKILPVPTDRSLTNLALISEEKS